VAVGVGLAAAVGGFVGLEPPLVNAHPVPARATTAATIPIATSGRRIMF
jgi:hypothetical protein